MKEVRVDPIQILKLTSYESIRFTSFVAYTFWLFNLLLLIGYSLTAGPMLFERLLESVARGNAPAYQPVVVAASMALPLVAMVFAHFSGLSRDNKSLSEFLVGVEIPIAAVLIGRSIWAHEISMTSLLLYSFMVGVAACQCWLLMQRRIHGVLLYRSPSLLLTAATAFVAVGGVYLSALAIVFTSPVIAGVLIGGGYMIFAGIPALVLFPIAIMVIAAGIAALAFGLFALWLSFYLPYCFLSQCAVRLKRSSGNAHKIVTAGVLLACVTAFLALHSKGRTEVFENLAQDQSSISVQTQLLDRAEEIRSGLLDAHLARLRYLPQDFGFGIRHPLIEFRDKLMGLLLPALVYQGNVAKDSRRAESQYEVFFDSPIQRAERETILAAHKNHWTPNFEPSAGLLDIGQRTVHVESQKVAVDVVQGVATVTVQEVLQNRTARRLETLQYFTLPEDAVVTGLWLSDTETEPEMFAFQVAPRGAAQQVYREEVQKRIDPALLELVGPRQYRLRVFPVLPNQPMVVTMTYKTLPDAQGHWPLPTLQEQRNIFWDKDTKRTINEQVVKADDAGKWLPQQLSPAIPNATNVSLGYIDGSNYIYAKPLTEYDSQGVIKRQRIAVLVDGSYSMGAHKTPLKAALNTLSGSDIYFCKNECVASNVDFMSDWIFYGNTQPLQQLRTFKDDSGLTNYDAVFLLSDGGSYESQPESDSLSFDTPVWLVELGQGVHAYRDSLLESVRSSKGNIVRSVNQALVDLNLHNMELPPNSRSDATSGAVAITSRHVWYERELGPADQSNDQLAQIIAGLKIKQLGESSDSNDSHDVMHEIAVRQGIVSNYSSMIVLVNDAQRRRLKDLSSADDRFEREVETGIAGSSVVATAVPEPHEWALMALGLLLLLFTGHKRGWRLSGAFQPVTSFNTAILADNVNMAHTEQIMPDANTRYSIRDFL